jgi:hypothetical protein
VLSNKLEFVSISRDADQISPVVMSPTAASSKSIYLSPITEPIATEMGKGLQLFYLA